MIDFFSNLSWPVFIIFVVLGIIIIMAIIGYFMEQQQLQKEEKNKRVVLDNPLDKQETNVTSIPQPEEKKEEYASFFTTPIENNIETTNNEIIENNNEIIPNINSEVKEEIQEENKIEVIDFGSTKDIEIDNNN